MFPDFDAFFRAVHRDSAAGAAGRTPFPWQQALVEQVYQAHNDSGQDPKTVWPEVIDVPTGLGKTAVLDVAIYVAAALPKRTFRRVFFVVDRRLVVDEAHRHAERIARAVNQPTDPATEAVARALRQPGDEDGPVIDVARMRGGVTWDARWVERPDRYAIVTGTVDQIGSRLLFRGYGVTPEARPIDAALVGTDSLIIIDEAHLAGPLIETISALRALDREFAGQGPTIVRMSATHSPSPHRVHTISPADEADPVAGPRLRAPKRLQLVEVRTNRTAAATAVPDALARLALSFTGTNRVVGVVTNTVARARAVYERIRAQQDEQDSVLLTGRTRPIDRDHLLSRHYERVRAGRLEAERPFVLVATQTIEVGADIDLDVLITESAPLGALVQRLGRLNRRGTRSAAPALVVHDPSIGDDDLVYGSARAATWNWLAQRPGAAPIAFTPRLDPTTLTGGLDASPLALRALTADHPRELMPPDVYTPVLPQSTLDAWVRTSPAPDPDPPVEPYLHGITETRPSVQIVWRVGLPNSDNAWGQAKREGAMPEALARVPMTADEAVEVPLVAVRQWLDAAMETAVLSDQDTEPPGIGDEQDGRTDAIRYRDPRGRVYVVRVTGRDDGEVITADQIRPGDLIVVPVEYGGCDSYGWHPTSTTPVVDVADLAGRRGRPTLRIGPHLRTVINSYHEGFTDHATLDAVLDWARSYAQLDDGAGDETSIEQHIRALAEALNVSGGGRLARNLARLIDKGATRRPTVWGIDKPWYVELVVPGGAFADDQSTNASSITRQRMRLDDHQRAVAAQAVQFARNLNLTSLLDDVRLAALLHDEGKRDPRFQAMLWGGDHRQAEIAGYLLAKSGMDPSDRAAHRRAQDRSGYPRGMRHEALSAQIAAHRTQSLGCTDPDLVVHLIAAHHGHSRPLLPPVTDDAPHILPIGDRKYSTAATVDWQSPARFARLNQRYGRWGLARLETIVRLADIWCSARDEPVKEADGAH